MCIGWPVKELTLRYLNGTADYGLHFQASTQLDIEAFTDADWGSCVDGKGSTTLPLVFVCILVVT